MLDSFFHWLGTAYGDELYLGGSKAAGILCSYADILVAAILLRVMDIIRAGERRTPKFRYGVLIAFAALTPILLLPQNGLDFFMTQFIVLAPPYLVLIYTAVTEAKFFMAYVRAESGLTREDIRKENDGAGGF